MRDDVMLSDELQHVEYELACFVNASHGWNDFFSFELRSSLRLWHMPHLYRGGLAFFAIKRHLVAEIVAYFSGWVCDKSLEQFLIERRAYYQTTAHITTNSEPPVFNEHPCIPGDVLYVP
jgi:hypothetical protein